MDRCRACLLAAVAVMGIVPMGTGGARATDPGDMDLALPFIRGCNGCDACNWPTWHHTNFVPPMADYSPPQHACQMGDCLEHGICGGLEPDPAESAVVSTLEALRLALLSGDPEELASVFVEVSPRATLNRARKAVQVTGCSGQVVAHFPLTEGQYAALDSQ